MWLLDKIHGLMGQQLAMDLGTANTLIYKEGNIVLDEPSARTLPPFREFRATTEGSSRTMPPSLV